MKWSIPLVAGMMFLSACAPDATVPTSVPDDPEPTRLLATLGDARARWLAAAPTDYTVTESCDGCPDRTVAVRSGEVVSLSSEDHRTVDEMFSQIENAIGDGAVVNATFDDDLGYPTSVTIDYDGDGVPEVDLRYADLQAMPIVTSLEELLEARERWESLGLDDYIYIFRADCTCSEEGTFQVTVIDGRATQELPLDDAARASTQISPGSLDRAFDDLEDWFTNSQPLIDEGILEVDVRMDPTFGYPRWFRVVGEGLDNDGPLSDRFEIIVTTDLVGPIEVPDVTGPTIDQVDLAALVEAGFTWVEADLADYRFEIEFHCECDVEVRGPFEVIVRDRAVVSSGPIGVGASGDSTHAPTWTIEDVFDVIERAIQEGTDVDVVYDPVTGQPLSVMIDPEAVASDGGLWFTMSPVEVVGASGAVDLVALAGPQCPVQQSPPDPDCEDAPVPGAVIILTRSGSTSEIRVTTDAEGRAVIDLEPGVWTITPLDVEGLLGTAPLVEVLVQSGQLVDVVVMYDTGIR